VANGTVRKWRQLPQRHTLEDWVTEIKDLGVQDVCIVVCDDLKGLPDSVTTTWPLATVQACVIHLLRNARREAPVVPIRGARPTTSGRGGALMKLGAA